LVTIIRNEGVKALFGGWLPRTTAISFGGGAYQHLIHAGYIVNSADEQHYFWVYTM
jgi:hypothetical protein